MVAMLVASKFKKSSMQLKRHMWWQQCRLQTIIFASQCRLQAIIFASVTGVTLIIVMSATKCFGQC
ncbi:hypothetical protein T484DRAFT_1779339 [Baffinella frigidus]|nr:hypothetical protein T484DRAFT_1779339 [Cryptophyta sp. CCMP2293]